VKKTLDTVANVGRVISAALSLLISSLFFKFAPPQSEANGEVERGEVLR